MIRTATLDDLDAIVPVHVAGFRAGPACDADTDGGELYALYVDPGSCGGGCGAALDAAAREDLAEHGFANAVLWVLEANERACRFYERQGWARDGSRREHLGAMAVRYRVTL